MHDWLSNHFNIFVGHHLNHSKGMKMSYTRHIIVGCGIVCLYLYDYTLFISNCSPLRGWNKGTDRAIYARGALSTLILPCG